jgi:hypothetical protein
VDPRDIESAEDLLESAYIRVDYILRRLQLLTDRITDDEMLVRIAMDGRRNELVGIDLLVNNVTMGFSYVSGAAELRVGGRVVVFSCQPPRSCFWGAARNCRLLRALHSW